MNGQVTASAPATTANLGPGFDCMAMALQPRCHVTAVIDDEWGITHHGPSFLGEGQPDAVLAAARHVSNQPLSLEVRMEFPIGKGLGSSAAALVAGVAAGLHAGGNPSSADRVYRIAAEMEGHPDQVAAAVYGGLVLIPAEGMPMRLPLHPSLRPVVAIPDTVLPTSQARAVIDRYHPLDRVIRSLARMGALTAGLLTGDPGMLAASHGDEIHEAPRARLSPEVEALIEIARAAGAFHAARSGAGPSVVAIASVDTAAHVSDALRRAGATVIDQAVDTSGLLVTG